MTHFAECAAANIVKIVSNVSIAKSTMRLRVEAPELAKHAVPGQFFMLRTAHGSDPLIGRAFALYDIPHGEGTSQLDIVYVIKGKFTTVAARLQAGEEIAIWGPLGNGFSNAPVDHLILVAGGIGQTPFMALAKEALGVQQFGFPARANRYAKRVSICYGARSSDYFAGLDDFRATGAEVLLATDDGSHGPPQLVTQLLQNLLDQPRDGESVRVACCGPEKMMEAVSNITRYRQVDCQVSLETPMACGIGICFTCVAKIGSESDWDYKRTCVEGPIFDANSIVW